MLHVSVGFSLVFVCFPLTNEDCKGYYCECDPSMRGDNCELARTECDASYLDCPHNSECSLVDGAEICDCVPTYTPSCAAASKTACAGVSLPVVNPNVCEGAGDCTYTAAGSAYTADGTLVAESCTASAAVSCALLGADQTTCEGDTDCEYIPCTAPPTDPCASSPCENGGTCTEYRDSFECVCAIGYTGHTCDLTSTWHVCGAGTCIRKVYGCMDPTMFTYYPLMYSRSGLPVAAVNTHRQTDCAPFVYGCLDDQKFNFEASVNTDDGTCVDFIYGCKDPLAFNYNDMANCGE